MVYFACDKYKDIRNIYNHSRGLAYTVRINSEICLLGKERAWVDWAAWLPGTCQVGRFVRRPGGPPRQMLK